MEPVFNLIGAVVATIVVSLAFDSRVGTYVCMIYNYIVRRLGVFMENIIYTIISASFKTRWHCMLDV